MNVAPERWTPAAGDRRQGGDRRGYTRGGRRRTDWPEGFGAYRCPRCDSPELRFVDATPSVYFWHCHSCRFDWSTRFDGTVTAD